MFDLDAYLVRIGMPARPTLDVAGLQRLQLAHRLAIPFENVDVALGCDIAIDSSSVFAKLVTARRGGYCFEQNRLFLDALAALGFVARPLLARVWLGASETPPLTHTLSLVTLPDGDWIADPGFGGSYSPPLPLTHGAEAIAPDGARFRLVDDEAAGWTLHRDGDSATIDGRGTGDSRQYGFTLAPVAEADLALGNFWSAHAPTSRFTNQVVTSIVLPSGFASLIDLRYRRKAGDALSEGIIDDPRVYRMRMSLMFGIDLSAEQVTALGLFA